MISFPNLSDWNDGIISVEQHLLRGGGTKHLHTYISGHRYSVSFSVGVWQGIILDFSLPTLTLCVPVSELPSVINEVVNWMVAVQL